MMTAMKMILTFLITVLLFAICCSNENKIQTQEGSDSLKIAVKNFKKDSLGCIGLRTKKSIEYIYQEGKLKGKTKSEVLSLIGTPNDSVSANGILNLRYYFKRICSNGIPVDSVEKCWSNLHVDVSSQRVSNIEFVCQ